MGRMARPLHVAMVSVHTSPVASPGSADAGGMNVYIANVARALGAAGHRVDLLTRRDHPDTPEVADFAPGVRVWHLPAGPASVVAKSKAEALVEPFTDEMRRWWDSEGAGVDVVHAHHWFAGMAALPVAREAGVPLLQSYHSVAAPVGAELGAGEQPESAGRPVGESTMAHEADLIVAVSDAEKRTIIERYGPAAARIRVVRPGVDTDRFRPLAEEDDADGPAWCDADDGGLDGGDADDGGGAPGGSGADDRPELLDLPPAPFLVFAARLQPLKGPDLAIDTVAELVARGVDARLVVAGAASADYAHYAETLHQRADAAGLSDRVTYLGALPPRCFATLLRRAALLLNPSHSETYGIVNLEAAASGTPVLATRTGGMVESVRDGITGVLLGGRDPRAWAEAARRVLENPALAGRLAEAGRAFALTRTWPAVAGELADVYREVAP